MSWPNNKVSVNQKIIKLEINFKKFLKFKFKGELSHT